MILVHALPLLPQRGRGGTWSLGRRLELGTDRKSRRARRSGGGERGGGQEEGEEVDEELMIIPN